MKLCRFELGERPGEVRSGIFHEGNVYETDGTQALGIHDPQDVHLLAPLGSAPSLRLFDVYDATANEGRLGYIYANPNLITGPDTQIEVPGNVQEMGVEIRIAATVSALATHVASKEAPGLILGYTPLLILTDISRSADVARLAQFRDVGMAAGPYMVTPDELGQHLAGGSQTNFQWGYTLQVNEHVVAKSVFESDFDFSDLLSFASETCPVFPGDLIAWPPLPVPDLDTTELGRNLSSPDTISLTIDGIGTLQTRLGVK